MIWANPGDIILDARSGHLLGKGLPLSIVCDVKLCFATFPCGILGQVWYLIVLIPDRCRLSYFYYYDNMFIIYLFLTLF